MNFTHLNTMLRAGCLFLLCAAVVTALPASIENERIVNGTDAPPGKYPFQVSYQSSLRHSCGGTIINELWVMTAAHCVDGDDVATISILAGTVDIYGNDGVRHEAEELIIYEGYDNPDHIHDIALVKLKTPLIWNDMVAPVTLPAQNQETPGNSNATVIGWGHPYLKTPFVWSDMIAPVTLPKLNQETPGKSNATLIGWGYEEEEGNFTQFLKEIDNWVVDDQECMDLHFYEIFETNICASYPEGGKGGCYGDNGGPLLVNGEQVGIFSYYLTCANPFYPEVFTEVSPYIDWIIATTEIN